MSFSLPFFSLQLLGSNFDSKREDVTVEGTLTQLQRLIEYLARHVRTLRRVTVATFNAQTATELRAFLAKGDTVA